MAVISEMDKIKHFLSVLNKMKNVKHQRKFLDMVKGKDYPEIMSNIKLGGLI
jgi:hypothetical protein